MKNGKILISSCSLAAIKFSGIDHWQSFLKSRFEIQGWSTVLNRHRIDIIPNTVSGKIRSENQFLNSFQLSSFWCGPGEHAIAITPIRKWLDASGHEDTRPEYIILNGRTPPSIDLVEQVSHIHIFLKALSMLEGFDNEQIELDDLPDNLVDLTNTNVKNHSFPCPPKPNELYHIAGFHLVPERFSVKVVPIPGVSSSLAADYAERLTNKFQSRSTTVSVTTSSIDKIEKLPGQAVVLLMPSSKEATINKSIIDVFLYLDRQGISWRRCYETDNFQFSIPDQIGSILQCAGGIPYCVQTQGTKPIPWCLGIDLSHATNGQSKLCGSLINTTGNLSHSWVSKHSRDETISSDTLQKIIRAAVNYIPKDSRGNGLLVMRDGRLFERENHALYHKGFDLPVSLIEVRKRKNPPILTREFPGIPDKIMFSEISRNLDHDSHIAFMVTLPTAKKERFGQVLKIHWRDEWNGLSLQSRDLAAIITALVYAPGLGNKERTLPAPIYWADGIAAASNIDLRFRGQQTTHI